MIEFLRGYSSFVWYINSGLLGTFVLGFVLKVIYEFWKESKKR